MLTEVRLEAMILLIILFGIIPLYYFYFYGYTELKITIYATTFFSLIFGYLCSEFMNISRKKISYVSHQKYLDEKLAFRILNTFGIIMFLILILASSSIFNLGTNYRSLFYTEQKAIFGFDRFGFIFQMFFEYISVSLFSIILIISDNKKWKIYLLLWIALGTAITFGRWYLIHGIIILLYAINGRSSIGFIFKNLKYLPAIFILLYFASLIFVCRGGACSSFSYIDISHGFQYGISNYFLIPIEMIDEYGSINIFSQNLFWGFSLYPIDYIGRFTSMYSISYEYDIWAEMVQRYVMLDNIGYYNALVGQPLTSYLALGYFGIFLHYSLIGFLINYKRHGSGKIHPIGLICLVVAVSSYFMPTLSGPMFIITLASYFIISKILLKTNIIVDK
jgi:hypothetical protein